MRGVRVRARADKGMGDGMLRRRGEHQAQERRLGRGSLSGLARGGLNEGGSLNDIRGRGRKVGLDWRRRRRRGGVRRAGCGLGVSVGEDCVVLPLVRIEETMATHRALKFRGISGTRGAER